LAINCAGLTETLVGSQLFGRARGAFTGAVGDHQGVLKAAEGGTLLLDEIGDLPLDIQGNLLRVLEEKEVTRLGENTPRKIDVRILAATHRDLTAASSCFCCAGEIIWVIAAFESESVVSYVDAYPVIYRSYQTRHNAR
jgi:transcriptional regulator with GAF, ATPase, and Fis domain